LEKRSWSACSANEANPVEVLPLARWLVMRECRALGLVSTLRMDRGAGRATLTENGNFIIDCAPPDSMRDGGMARELELELLAIVGVVDTGLFLVTAERILVGHPDGSMETFRRAEE
jgi:ribose 5-phosphate isomerase A